MSCAFRQHTIDNALWRFETGRFAIEFHATPEDLDPADHFEYADDVERARSGSLEDWFTAIVLVRGRESGDVIGWDTLGGCSYASLEEFYTAHRDRDPGNRNTLALKAQRRAVCHYFPDMVSQALACARNTLQSQRGRASHIKGVGTTTTT